jgi:hypothetical protein
MQISAASLLAAQQARSQTPVQPRAAQAKPSAGDAFEPLVFAAKAEMPAAKPTSTAMVPQTDAAPFARPGSQLDIKI